MDYKDKAGDLKDDEKINLAEDGELMIPRKNVRKTAIGGKNKNAINPAYPLSLKKIREDEERWNDIKHLTIFEFIGKPSFKNPNKIPEKEIQGAVNDLLNLCESKGISLVIRGYYPPKEIYSFITTELFKWRADTILQPDCICKIYYEDYHPNHKLAIEDISRRFLDLWLGQRIREFNFELSDVFVTVNGQIKTKFDVLARMQKAFELYTNFSEPSFYFSQVSFNWDEKEKTGTGHAEGTIRYTAEKKKGNTIAIEGGFKFYLTNENGSWEIFFFVLPGFTW